jgi:5-amino-6-(5-phospho-D-ribitylamino)uracil phosphatase
MAAREKLLIALDVDGTLIHPDESISDAVLEQVHRVRGAGHEVMLATGRSWETARHIQKRFELDSEYVVCANGAVTMKRDAAAPEGYRREYVETFDPTEVLNTVHPALPTSNFMVEDASGFRRYTAGMTDWEVSNGLEVPFEELARHEATRVVVTSPDHNEEEFLDIVEKMGLHRVTYAIGWTAWLDIAPEGVNKGTAIERVRRKLGIPLSRLVAVGDGRNDVDMLRLAAREGIAVAMGQAPDDVKDLATEVTGTVQEDGLAQVLARF